MKLHDLRPAAGSRTRRQRVGRGIAAGGGKTAGRGTKGQKARTGGSLPAWFEGGQTPLHQRLPKLHGFRNPMKIEYEIVNVGAIARLVELGTLETGEAPLQPAGRKPASKAAGPITVNQEILRAAGLVRTLDKPMKVLGNGELSAALFVVADAFTASARSKIEAAGGSVSVLEVPTRRIAALKLEPEFSAPQAAAPEVTMPQAAVAEPALSPAAAPKKPRAKTPQAAVAETPPGPTAQPKEPKEPKKPRTKAAARLAAEAELEAVAEAADSAADADAAAEPGSTDSDGDPRP